ncbi:MAG: hypothetical protein ACLRVT_08740 [Oscillospiraceae bacterium]
MRFENASFRYNDDVADEEPVLKNISFTAQEESASALSAPPLRKAPL